MNKLTSIFIGLAVLVGLFFFLSQPPQGDTSTAACFDIHTDFYNYDLVFYWGDGCPHCQNVDTWLTNNNKDKKLKILSREIYQDKNNQQELLNLVTKFCPELLKGGGIGVPTSFDPVGQKCIQGDTPIIEFLSEKLKL